MQFRRYLEDNGSFKFPLHLNSDEGLVGLCRVRIKDSLRHFIVLAQRIKLIEDLLSAAYAKATHPHGGAAFM